jgi:hypothetical protein
VPEAPAILQIRIINVIRKTISAVELAPWRPDRRSPFSKFR